MRSLVAYTPDDEARVRATRNLLLPQADAIADAVYAHLLSHPETRLFFVRPDGTPDEEHLALRKKTLKEWLLNAIEGSLDERTADYLAGVGRAHARRGGDPNVRVKARYLLVTMSFAQTALSALLDSAIEDRAEMAATVRAWNKLLMLHLDLFLSVYDSAEATPHWY